MTADNVRLDDERDPIDCLAEEFTERCRRGESPSIEEYAEKYPELAEQIERLFPSIAMMEQLGAVEQVEHQAAQQRAVLGNHRVERFGDFRIIQEIGRGGMGIVYEAIQESLGRRVAVKLLAQQSLLDEKHLRRFEREARTAGRLHHTNIVPVFGVGTQDDYYYYVMQFIRGAGLDEVLYELRRIASKDIDKTTVARSGRTAQVSQVVAALREGVFLRQRQSGSSSAHHGITDTSSTALSGVAGSQAPGSSDTDRATEPTLAETECIQDRSQIEADAESNETDAESSARAKSDAVNLGSEYCRSVAKIGLQVADALAYAHSQRTLHRDIKPGNLLLDADGAVWVADFGLAKALEHDDVSRTGDVVGTLRYMSPEQFAGEADHRSDIYSLGLTIYEMLTLTPAHSDSSRAHLLRGERGEVKVTAPRALNTAISRDLETIVLKACQREPNDRYQTAAELAADLQCFLDDRPIRARQPSAGERFVKWCRRNPAVASLASLAALLLITIAVTTSIGYMHISAALERESTAKEQAETEQQKAEATLAISLDVLEKVYNRFAPDRMVESSSRLTVEDTDGQQLVIPAQPVLSTETAAMLEDILGFYDQFAQQDINNVQLQNEAAKATRRVGDIQQRLGAYEKAEHAYQSAIDRYSQLQLEQGESDSYKTILARIHNELGNVYRAWQRPPDAQASYQSALDLLQPAGLNDQQAPQPNQLAEAAKELPIEMQFELARTYYLLAKRDPTEPGGGGGGPPGRGRGGRGRPPQHSPGQPPGPPFDFDGPPEHKGPPPREHDGPPPREHDGSPREHRGRGPDGPPRGPGGGWQHIDQAIELLSGLVGNGQDHPEHRYLLALCYRERVRSTQSSDWEKTVEILTDLSEQYPLVADYRYQLSETYAKTNMRGLRDTELQVTLERLQTALGYAEALAVEHPNIPEYAHSRAHINLKLGTAQRRLAVQARGAEREAGLEQSEQHYREAVRIQSSLIEQFPTATSYRLWLAKMQESLAETLISADKLTEARTIMDSSIASLDAILEAEPHLSFVHHAVAEHNLTLALILERMGDSEGARQARETADQHRRQPPGGLNWKALRGIIDHWRMNQTGPPRERGERPR